MKRSIVIFVMGLVLLFGFTGCDNKDNSEISDALKFKEEYESLNGESNEGNGKKYRDIEIDDDNPFVYKSEEEIIEMIDNEETFVVYFGFASCPWCRSIINPLMEVVDDLEIYPIYYVDVKEIRDVMVIDENGEVVTKKEGTDAYYELLEKLDTVLDDYILIDEDGNEVVTGEKRIYAPNIVSVVDGEVRNLTDGIGKSQDDAYMELTDEMKEESYNKIKCSIECVANKNKVCSAKTKC